MHLVLLKSINNTSLSLIDIRTDRCDVCNFPESQGDAAPERQWVSDNSCGQKKKGLFIKRDLWTHLLLQLVRKKNTTHSEETQGRPVVMNEQ